MNGITMQGNDRWKAVRRALDRAPRAAVALGLSLTLTAGLAGCAGATMEAATSTASTQAASTSTAASSVDESAYDLEYSDRDLDASYDASTAVSITLSGSNATSESSAVTVDGSTVTITEAGVYVVSGELSDDQLRQRPSIR